MTNRTIRRTVPGVLDGTRTRPHAYTLMELGVVLVLTVLLVFGMVRWLVGIGYSARTGIENATDQRAALALEQFDDDVLGLRHCEENGTDARIVSLTATGLPTQLTMVTDPDGDGISETVSWRISGGDIQRGEAAMGENCAPGAVTGWTTWVQGADSFTVTLLRGGAEDPTGTTGTCTNEYSDRCKVSPLVVEIVLDETSAKRVYGS
jgi:hypothetical protein